MSRGIIAFLAVLFLAQASFAGLIYADIQQLRQCIIVAPNG